MKKKKLKCVSLLLIKYQTSYGVHPIQRTNKSLKRR